MLDETGGFAGLKKEMQKDPRLGDKDFFMFKKEIEETIALEKEFYKKTGVSQELFDITQQAR